jgi:hypothetical protein
MARLRFRFRKAWVILLLLLVLQQLAALEVRSGLIKIILHEAIGRFSLYYLTDSEKQTYVPFFLDQDPRTSTLSILSGNRIYRFGDTTAFKESFEATESGARFLWTSNTLEITEDFSFITSTGASEADGVEIALTIRNLTERDVDVGVRYLFDTYLGEETNIHFQSDRWDQLGREQSITMAGMFDYWISPAPPTQAVEGSLIGVRVITSGVNVTIPDQLIFANWKRLNDSSWDYETSSSRNFNLLPYSINDSAVVQIYDPVSVAQNSSRQVILQLMSTSPSGTTPSETALSFTAPSEATATDTTETTPSETSTSDTAEATATPPTAEAEETAVTSEPGSVLSMRGDLKEVGDIISKINALLAAEEISEADLLSIQKSIEELSRKYPKE